MEKTDSKKNGKNTDAAEQTSGHVSTMLDTPRFCPIISQ